MSKLVFIETMGCAMNEHDSERMLAELRAKEGYAPTNDPTLADLILINTCSVREKPERKLFSEIGQYSKLRKDGAKIGICGCSASHMGAEILRKAPAVSFVLGARNIAQIARIIHRDKAVETDIGEDNSHYAFATLESPSKLRASINISIGCDKKCAYCIVPHTRGKEISIPLDIILAQAQRAIDGGAKEILLLGQNVNSYGKTFSSAHPKVDFTKLLAELAKIPNMGRIRFTSPHPLHMDDAFLDEFARNDKVCKSIHMPLQSGSTKILKLMRRGYSQEWFLERAKRLRAMIPSLTIGTDIIVGFPRESEEDFLQTMHVLEEVRFDTMYSFIYSPRPHTEAAQWDNDVPHSVALKRLSRLQERQKEIMDANNQREIGSTCETLWEIPREDGLMEGRSDNAKIVRAPLKPELIGQISAARILDSRRTYLIGEAI